MRSLPDYGDLADSHPAAYPTMPNEITHSHHRRTHTNQRLKMEDEHEAQLAVKLRSWPAEKLKWSKFLIRSALIVTGLYQRGLANAVRVELKHNVIESKRIPRAFDGYTFLHLSDLHADINAGAMDQVMTLVSDLRYDACIFTGDFRGETFGPSVSSLEQLARLRNELKGPLFGVLGNHDSMSMMQHLEQLGIRVLLNECEVIERSSRRIHLAGVDDAHYYQLDNVCEAAADIPAEEFSILLSHTPEVYRKAADAGFDVVFCGHTHGGQICLPGGIPITLDAKVPRRMGSGAWKFGSTFGYTSVGAGSSIVPVRFNCPPEITLHHLRAG